ncbi:unnamed protein product [Tuber melanosporum]|uniref:ER membrane protein complex subunit 2 n=1 Tax=Tuber melanosporum (strain Mel28) TaxID=656061 RepID=D5G5N4_TUBMM|nr:uncharacterized protein GSTUM_00001500001 [Tuber melanosporum]KAG0134810.1 hypothetical protein HOY82DRAFT_196295 [Tuber indicum]CAZ79827.1 unnamed protein product [Tuber melanosporum]
MAMLKLLLSYLSIHPSPLRNPSTSLHLSQQAPAFLSSSESTKDTQETWLIYEQLLLSCLRTGDDSSARVCLQRLSGRFGVDSARVKALTGLYDEATSNSRGELESVLQRYQDILKEDPTNMPIEKRRISLLLSLGRTEDGIEALTSLLSHSPNDAESWAHLSSLYFTQGLYQQSVFCLEEVLLILPNAYNIFARIGEVTYISASAGASGTNQTEAFEEAIKYFARSVELSEWYLRGWYGLKLVTGKFIQAKPSDGTLRKMESLNQLATEKLLQIVGRFRRNEKGWMGFDEAEILAAKNLIDRDEQKFSR